MGPQISTGCFCALLAALGASIFSFLNVIVYRVPRGQSFVKGHSICPACGHRLGVADLIPVFSYLFLRGKCRYCGARIGVRDTLTELLGAALALLCIFHYREPGAALTAFAFFSVLTVVSLLDLATMEIEDGCHIAILAIAALSLVTMPGLSILDRLIGAVCVSVPMLLLAIAIPGAFGGGDIRLMAASGLLLGWKLTLVAAALGVLTGGLYGIWLLVTRKKGKKDRFAFGPFLCIGMAVSLLYGNGLLNLYLDFILLR